MDKTLIINLTRLTQQVDVRHADGKLDRIQLVRQGRANLRDGMTVDTRWLQKNPGVLKVVQTKLTEAPSSAPSVPVFNGGE